MRFAWKWILLCLAAFALAGCGGGDGGSTPIVGAAPVTLGVDWAARARNVNAPSSALSFVATIPGGSEQGTDVVLTANRDLANPAAYSQTYTFPANIKTGNQTVNVRFYAKESGAGDVVGTASNQIFVQTTTTSAGNFTTSNKITQVEIAAGQSVDAGSTKDFTVTAKDAQGNVVVVTTGSIATSVTGGANFLQFTSEGKIEGKAAGQATVTATVDGVTSASQTVNVVPKITQIAAYENGGLYGTVQLRVKGIGALTDTVAVTVGGVAATVANAAITDANAPAGSTTLGGAVNFRVPTGLAAGEQAVVVTVNNVAAAGLAVKVSNVNPFATFTLAKGKFVAELRRDKSPNTVDNFTGLATGTKTWTPTYNAVVGGQVVSKTAGPAQNTPFYDGVTFHRVEANFVKQAGDPVTKISPAPSDWQAGTGGPGFTIDFETNDLTHEDGAVAMARGSDRNSAGSQFYIADGAQRSLDGNYVVFGKVIENLATAKAIQKNDVLQSVTISGKIDTP